MADQRAGDGALQELRSRLAEKAVTLSEMADRASALGESRRLRGKAEGVDLAISFVDELLREGRISHVEF